MEGQVCIGSCSHCGGNVMAYRVWWGTGPFPDPQCAICGAVAKTNKPVIPMQRVPREFWIDRSSAERNGLGKNDGWGQNIYVAFGVAGIDNKRFIRVREVLD